MPEEYFSCIVNANRTNAQGRAFQRAGDRWLKECRRFKAASKKYGLPFKKVSYARIDSRWDWQIDYDYA